jgi:hypothetical protein
MPKKLYIIGNGFDLHHYLKTSYYEFSNFLRENYFDIYSTIDSFVSYPSSENELWSKFEENLANLNADEILADNTDYLPNYASEEFKERDRYVFPDIMDEYYQKLTSGLLSAFEEFILQVKYPNLSWERKIEIDSEATFLSFNYTNTLERLYSIKRSKILYIHNSAFYDSGNIILGHGIDPESFVEKKLEPPEDLAPEKLSEWYEMNDDFDYSYDEGKNILMKYFKFTYKPTKEIIGRHFNFFSKLKMVNEIFVFGHSISSVDFLYFEEIVKNIRNNVLWTVSFYNTYENKSLKTTLENLGIAQENIRLIYLEDIQLDNKQLKIKF